MSNCTIFRELSIPIESKSIHQIADWISTGKFSNEIDQIRVLLSQDKVDKAQFKKKKLLAFTPSATFKEKRLRATIDQYSGFVHLDFDKLTPEQIQASFKIITLIPYTFLCFRSPGGRGYKVFVEVDTGADEHESTYLQVMKYYEKATGLKADLKCKDITRLCFMSDDGQLFKNNNNQKFIANVPAIEASPYAVSDATQASITNDDYIELWHYCERLTKKKKTYKEGSRNDFIYFLASNCNREGIPIEDALQFAQANYDLQYKELVATFSSAYNHHTNEFAKFAIPAKLESPVSNQSEDYLKNTPSVPDELFHQMPVLIRDGANVFTDPRERDVFLTGALAIISGCLPGVKGLYAGQEVKPNIFAFVIAPPASGKGALKYAKILADEYHNTVLKASREANTIYNRELAEQKQRNQKKKKGDTITEDFPEKPPFKVVYIPANTSYAKMLWHLEQNEGRGIICETEADTLANVFKKEWGAYSDLLRKSFHHERASSSKKTNDEFIEVDAPCVSVALSGTPNQVTGLIASAEDGLFSRFLFYAFKVEQQWNDVSPQANNINLTDYFKQLSLQVFKLVEFLHQEETNIELTTEQWSQLNKQCEVWLFDITMFTEAAAASIVKRLGLILYRIAMVFTAIRKFENGTAGSNIVCTDSDFRIALQLASTYLHHSILMFNNLPKQSEGTKFKMGDSKREFISALPKEFTTHQAIEIGKKFSLSYSTITHLLPKLIPSHFSQPKAGYYCKH